MGLTDILFLLFVCSSVFSVSYLIWTPVKELIQEHVKTKTEKLVVFLPSFLMLMTAFSILIKGAVR